ncbi:hypothetical protein HDU96_002502 [Phlyctochytrium bullatum]|nr:hypothetical protein HDU96_002502 [Phlyctochytrium bullatum]
MSKTTKRKQDHVESRSFTQPKKKPNAHASGATDGPSASKASFLKPASISLSSPALLPIPNKRTISVALSASFIEHFEKPELRTYAAGQIGRALALFRVDEVVVYPDAPAGVGKSQRTTDGTFESASKKKLDGVMFLARVLQYLEAPPYLRKALFPVHRDLKFAGLMNPIEASHHVKLEDESLFREGVTTEKQSGGGTLVDCGLQSLVRIDRAIKPNVRVTVKLDSPNTAGKDKQPKGTVVSPSTPKEEHGIYWGFTIRVAPSISKVFSECPYGDGYDLKVGVSDSATMTREDLDTNRTKFTSSQHLLLVLGGTKGLEYSIGCDEDLKVNEEDAAELFDVYVNMNSHQVADIRRGGRRCTPPVPKRWAEVAPARSPSMRGRVYVSE